jgi:hypothetical protein
MGSFNLPYRICPFGYRGKSCPGLVEECKKYKHPNFMKDFPDWEQEYCKNCICYNPEINPGD